MKRSLRALGWAAACWLMSAQAQAQSPSTYVQPVAYRTISNSGCTTEPGADQPCTTPAEATCAAPGSSGCCDRSNTLLNSIFCRCCSADPWTLKGAKGFNYGGWMQLGWQDRADGAFTDNGPFLNQREHGKVQMNQLYSFVEKVADGTCGLDIGGRFDAFYGVDGNEGQAFGNIDGGKWDYLNGFGGPNGLVPEPKQHGAYEIALPQAYAQVAYGKLSTKIGHFYTPVGYEVVTSPANFFLSRQMTFYNSEPFTHTGVYSTYTANEKFNFSGGWVYGMDTGFHQYHNGSAALGGFTWVANDFLTINNYAIMGNLGWRGQGMINSLIASLNWSDRFQTVHQFDVLGSTLWVNAGGIPFGAGALVPSSFQTSGIARNSTGFINYAFYKINDCLKAGSRLEWYKADGVSYQTWTNGFNYKIGPNVMIRPESRYMWSNDKTSFVGANLFGNGHRMVWGCDLIVTF